MEELCQEWLLGQSNFKKGQSCKQGYMKRNKLSYNAFNIYHLWIIILLQEKSLFSCPFRIVKTVISQSRRARNSSEREDWNEIKVLFKFYSVKEKNVSYILLHDTLLSFQGKKRLWNLMLEYPGSQSQSVYIINCGR